MDQAQPSGADEAASAIAGLNLEQREETGEEPEQRLRGVVRWFNASKGFGFIQAEGTPEEADAAAQHDLFVHQTSIQAEGFRSLREGEPVEFDVEPGEDGRNKAINVSGPGGAPPLGAPKRPQMQQRRGQLPQQPPSPMMLPSAAAQQQQLQQQYAAAAQYGGYPHMYPGSYPGASGYPPGPAAMGGMYPQQRPPRGMGGPGGGGMGGGMPGGGMPGGMRPPLMGGSMLGGMGGYGGYPGGQQQQQQQQGGRGGGRWPGGGVADRRPPPGTPGVSSGLQVVVHNLPWTCSWQQLKDAFVEAGVANIERADVIIDSSGRSRGFGTVSFPTAADATAAVETMNNMDIGGRAVTVRIDRFA